MIEDHLKGEVIEVDGLEGQLRKSFEKFLAWKEKQKFKFIQLEIQLHSKKYKYAGTVDAVAIEKSEDPITKKEITKTYLFDWKTSKNIYNVNALQLSAYAYAYEEMYGVKIDEAFVVKIDKVTKSVSVKKISNLSYSFSTFKAALFLYGSLKKNHFSPNGYNNKNIIEELGNEEIIEV